jgi:hypothetical protein
MKKEYPIMEESIHNLELAIKYFIKDKEGSAAILLAGAAAEIFYDEVVKIGKKPIVTTAKEDFSKIKNMDIREVNKNHANKVRNWLKHPTSPTLVFDKDEEAIQYVLRAIISYNMIFNKFEKCHYDFFFYVKKNYPEIISRFDEKAQKQMKVL